MMHEPSDHERVANANGAQTAADPIAALVGMFAPMARRAMERAEEGPQPGLSVTRRGEFLTIAATVPAASSAALLGALARELSALAGVPMRKRGRPRKVDKATAGLPGVL